jgi:hypothetical protein
MPNSVKMLMVVNQNLTEFTNSNWFRGDVMIRIAVCDDNDDDCFDLEKMLKEIAK